MSIRKRDELRVWMLGAATTGLLWQSYPAVGQSADPVASNAIAATTKAAPAQPIAEPRPLPVASGTAGSNAIQLVADASGGKSEVQKQLEALYEQDGREMPDTGNFNMQPVTPQTSSPQPPAQAQPVAPPAKSAAKPVFAPRTQAMPTATVTQKPRYHQGFQQQYQPRHQAAQYPNQNQTYSQSAQPVRQEAPPLEPPRALQQPQSKNPVVGFFRKLSGSNRPLSTQAPVPPDAVHPTSEAPMLTAVPNVPASVSASGMRPMTQTPVTTGMPTQVPAGTLANRSNSQAQSTRPATAPKLATATTTNVQTASRVNSTPAEAAPAIMPLPPLSDEPMPMPIVSVTITPATPVATAPAATAPPLAIEPQLTASAAQPMTTKEKAAPPKAEVVGDFPNPFPDEPEMIADRKQAVAVTGGAAISVNEQTPKTSAVLSRIAIPEATVEASQSTDLEEPNSIETPAEDGDEPRSLNVSAPDEDPFAVEGKDFVEPMIKETAEPRSELGVPSLGAAPALITPPSEDARRTAEPAPFNEQPSSEIRDIASPTNAAESPKNIEPHLEKMNRIRERFGMKGLKGFCPVSLRDDRELIDARLEYQFTYRKQKFHFSSAKAREKFEANPIRYAPAAYGADVVALTRDKDVIEGTLEYAAWYKGRLYLLGSQGNYDAFLADPSLYATPDGIE